MAQILHIVEKSLTFGPSLSTKNNLQCVSKAFGLKGLALGFLHLFLFLLGYRGWIGKYLCNSCPTGEMSVLIFLGWLLELSFSWSHCSCWQLSLQVHCCVAAPWKRIASVSWGHSCSLSLKGH